MEDKKKYQFFISSTYDDLKEERKEILDVILRLNHIPAGMEFFFSFDKEQLKFIRGVIDESDYYVLILAARYGSIDDEGISYTEREYDYAVSKGKRVIALIHANPDKIEREKTDKDENLFKKLIKFRNKVKKGRLVSFWGNTTELVSKFQSSLIQTIKLYPEIGWVRGNAISSQQAQQKIKDLEEQNKLLNENIDKCLKKISILEKDNRQCNESNNNLLYIQTLKQEKLKQKEQINIFENHVESEIIIEACSATNPYEFSKNEIKCITIDLEIYGEEDYKYLLNNWKVDIEKFRDMLKTCCLILQFYNPNSFYINIDDIEHHFLDSDGNKIYENDERIIIYNKIQNIFVANLIHTLYFKNQFPIKLSPQTPFIYNYTRLFKINQDFNIIYQPIIYVNHTPIYKRFSVKCKIIHQKLHVLSIVNIIKNLVKKEKFNETGTWEYVSSIIIDNGWK